MVPPSGVGLVLCFACLALAWGCSFLFIKVALDGLSPTQVVLGAVVVLVIAPFTALQPVRLDLPVVLSVLVLGALSTGLAYIWNTQIVAGWGATSAASVTYLTPVVGVIAGVLVLG